MEKLYKIEQPDIKKLNGAELLESFENKADISFFVALKKTETPEYLHWRDIKYKTWLPQIFSNDNKKKFWAIVKYIRKIYSKKTPIQDKNQKKFSWKKLDHFEKILHEIDINMSNYLLDFPNISKIDHKKYQLQGLIEESIASSQLEGAHTTRKIAKQMIEEKREPRTHAEKMIFNNFITMKAIEEKYKDQKLSLDILLEMHQKLTIGTMKESEQGYFRSDRDKIVIQKSDDPTIISYVTPPIEFVRQEIEKFIDFANDELEEENFIHPVIKAIMLHFWIGLLHPFIDGNGRLARGIFYWYLLRKGYWAFAFLPISIVIKNAPSAYSEAYILSEQDDNDLTYFIDYHIRKINQAADNFKKYARQKSDKNAKIEKILFAYKNLNRRQVEILTNFKQNPSKLVNVTSHKNIYEITKATAIKDLKSLLKQGFVYIEKHGKNVFYKPTKKINELQ
jgi:Fic family protein